MDKLLINLNKYLSINLIMTVGLALRLITLFIYPDQNFPDAQGYRLSGKTFFETGFVSSHLHMPLYIIWTHIWGGGVWLKITDITMSVISIYLIYLLSLEIFKDKMCALLSALMAAIYPYFIFYSVSRLTETSFITLALAAFWLLYNNKYFLASILLVLSLLIRPTFDLLNPFLIFYFAYIIQKLPLIKALKKIGVYSLIYTALLSPWWVHNTLKYGEFVRLNLGDGYVLYSGNNSKNKSGGGVATANLEKSDLDMSAFNSIANPIEKNRALKQSAIDFIGSNPKVFLKLTGIKFIRFWRLWPYAEEYNTIKIIIISLLSYGVVLILSILFTLLYFKAYWRKILPFYLFSGYLMLVHVITISSTRYRLPIEPFMIILAGFMIEKILNKRKKANERKA